MHAIEFETDIVHNVIEIPEEYKEIYSKHVKVIVLIEEKKANYDFSDLSGKLEWSGDELKLQRESRDAW